MCQPRQIGRIINFNSVTCFVVNLSGTRNIKNIVWNWKRRDEKQCFCNFLQKLSKWKASKFSTLCQKNDFLAIHIVVSSSTQEWNYNQIPKSGHSWTFDQSNLSCQHSGQHTGEHLTNQIRVANTLVSTLMNIWPIRFELPTHWSAHWWTFDQSDSSCQHIGQHTDEHLTNQTWVANTLVSTLVNIWPIRLELPTHWSAHWWTFDQSDSSCQHIGESKHW